MAVGEEANVADAMEAVRQGVLQEAADELVGRQGHELGLAVLAVVLPGEADLAVGEPDEPAVGDGDPVGVAAEMAEHLLGSGERRLDQTRARPAPTRQLAGEHGGIGQRGKSAGEAGSPSAKAALRC